jgi:hypothetical protein
VSKAVFAAYDCTYVPADEKGKDYRIDIFGWSRGAVAAVVVAQKIEARYLKDIADGINRNAPPHVDFLGLIDPVAKGIVFLPKPTIPNTVQWLWYGPRSKNDGLDDKLFFPKWPIVFTGYVGWQQTQTYDLGHAATGFTPRPVEADMQKSAENARAPF